LDLEIIEVATKDQLEIVHLIREIVFIKEQNVPRDREYDEFEDLSIHFLAYRNKEPAGCIRYRMVEKKVKLERLAVLKEYRGMGIGRALMDHVEMDSQRYIPAEYVLGSQLYAVEFYKRCGYESRGEVFLDANIEHIEMFKAARSN
jgi:predicted GNAT family N-acyltransferase